MGNDPQPALVDRDTELPGGALWLRGCLFANPFPKALAKGGSAGAVKGLPYSSCGAGAAAERRAR